LTPLTFSASKYHLGVLFVTIWLALALFVVAEAGKGPLGSADGAARWARPAWTAGALLAIVHAVIALAARYGWDHEAAVRATAEQSAALYGVGWRGSIYVNYIFLALWLVAAWSWRHWVWRLFVLTMIVNGAIVFARPGVRPIGAALVIALVWAWWHSNRESRIANRESNRHSERGGPTRTRPRA
jgi:hypothetical protein